MSNGFYSNWRVGAALSFVALWGAVSFSASAFGAVPEGLEDDEVFPRALAASADNVQRLKTARGTAIWKAWHSDGRQWIDADLTLRITFVAKAGRYNAHLRFRKTTSSPKLFYDRRHIVCDGEFIAFTRFSGRIRPGGCEAELFKSDITGFVMATGGCDFAFRFDRLRSPLIIASLPPATKFLAKEALRSGDIKYRLRLASGSELSLLVSPKHGYHVIEQSFNIPGKPVDLRCSVHWKKYGKVWWPQRYEILRTAHSAGDKSASRQILEWTDVKANVENDASLFTLDALEKCKPMRLIDRRPGVPPNKRVRQLTRKDKDLTEKRLNAMAAQVDKLPLRNTNPEEPSDGPPVSSRWRIWLIVFNVAVFAGIAGWWWWRNRKARRLPSDD